VFNTKLNGLVILCLKPLGNLSSILHMLKIRLMLIIKN